jgi:DNA-binding MarR family transcriptional regulator
VEEEFTAGYGIADIVGIKCNKKKLKSRYDSGSKPVTNIRELSILTLLQENNPSNIEDLASKIGLSVSYIKKILLKSLIEKGYIERKDNIYKLVKDIFSFTDLVVSVEAKLTKWKDALAQAKRYQHFSNIVFVALPQPTVKKINKELFKKNNIGVLSVDSKYVSIDLKPRQMKPKTLVMHLYCNEIFFEKQKVLR